MAGCNSRTARQCRHVAVPTTRSAATFIVLQRHEPASTPALVKHDHRGSITRGSLLLEEPEEEELAGRSNVRHSKVRLGEAGEAGGLPAAAPSMLAAAAAADLRAADSADEPCTFFSVSRFMVAGLALPGHPPTGRHPAASSVGNKLRNSSCAELMVTSCALGK